MVELFDSLIDSLTFDPVMEFNPQKTAVSSFTLKDLVLFLQGLSGRGGGGGGVSDCTCLGSTNCMLVIEVPNSFMPKQEDFFFYHVRF